LLVLTAAECWEVSGLSQVSVGVRVRVNATGAATEAVQQIPATAQILCQLQFVANPFVV